MKPCFFGLVLFLTSFVYASGGYDHGTMTGKGQLQLDFTWNPFDVFEFGQTYVVWGYGITDTLDFHGYVSHEGNGANQIYYGLMRKLYSGKWLDLATAVGYRHRKEKIHFFFPQLLYTIKFPNAYQIGGSWVQVYEDKNVLGKTFDVSLFIPVFRYWRPRWLSSQTIQSFYFGIGSFRSTSGRWHPTYSLDFKFGPVVKR